LNDKKIRTRYLNYLYSVKAKDLNLLTLSNSQKLKIIFAIAKAKTFYFLISVAEITSLSP